MSRIKFFEKYGIAVYIYGEKHSKHHGKHILVLKSDEACQYDFNGYPLSCSNALKSKKDRKMLRKWILLHKADLEDAWENVNNGIKPKTITD